MFVFHYVAAAHIMGGIVIFFGLMTRWIIWVQITILIGIILINYMGTLVFYNLLISSLVLIACVFFLAFGGGKHSADYYFKLENN